MLLSFKTRKREQPEPVNASGIPNAIHHDIRHPITTNADQLPKMHHEPTTLDNNLIANINLPQRRRQLLLLPLLLHLHQKLRILTPLIMNPTLRLLRPLPPPRPLILPLLHRLRTMPIAHTLIPTIQQLIIRHVMLPDILLNLPKRPARQRINLNQPGLIHLDDIKTLPLRALRASPPRQHRRDREVRVRALRRLDFSDPVIQIRVCLPELFAVLRFESSGCGDAFRFVDVQVHVRVPRLRFLDQVERFLEVVQRVEEYGVDGGRGGGLGLQFREHVEGDEAGDAEGGGLVEVGEGDLRPAEDFEGGEAVEGVVEEFEMLFGEDYLGEVAF